MIASFNSDYIPKIGLKIGVFLMTFQLNIALKGYFIGASKVIEAVYLNE